MGILVARALRGRVPDGVELIEHEGEPTALLDTWESARLAVVIDATEGAGTPGTIRCFDATDVPLPASATGRSTHAFTVAEAIELGRTLGRLPSRLWVVGIEGSRFTAGAEVSAPVSAELEHAAVVVLDLLRMNY